MKKETKKTILDSMTPLLQAKSPFVSTEAARIILAAEGIFPFEGITAQPGSGKVTAQLTLARANVAERLQRKKQRKRVQNHRAYLRRKLRALKQEKANQTPETHDEKH
jgi:hypothetical protein